MVHKTVTVSLACDQRNFLNMTHFTSISVFETRSLTALVAGAYALICVGFRAFKGLICK
jgi:hypothetical protein